MRLDICEPCIIMGRCHVLSIRSTFVTQYGAVLGLDELTQTTDVG